MNIGRFALALLIAGGAAADAGASYEDVGVGARVTGLGHAYTAVADDVYSIYYNPAGLATLDRPEFGTTYSKLLTGLSDGSNLQNSFLGYAHPLKGGRQGTIGVAWNYFTLGGLYRESQFFGSYGRGLFARADPDRYYVGGSLKLLNRSLGATPEAGNAISNTGVATGSADPALQKTSKTNVDADLGFLWRVRPRWTVGAQVQHVLEPNVGFADNDKLGRNLKLGGAYRTPFSTLTSDLRFQSAPDGALDKVLAVGVEKWLPTLLHGSFGVRGALSIGSRDFRQLAFGLSYKLRRMQFDYGFALPMGGLSSTSGSHRMGLTLRFGRSRQAEAAFGEAILEGLTDLAPVGTPEFRYQMDELAVYKKAALDEFLRQAKVDATEGRLLEAASKLAQALSIKPRDVGLQASRERMSLVAEVYPQVAQFKTDAGQASVLEGALSYVSGDAKEALRKLSYAGRLKPEDPQLEALAKSIEARSGESRAALLPPADKPLTPQEESEKLVGGLIALMDVAMRERDYEKVVEHAQKVLAVDPLKGLAYKRLGAALYALKRHEAALKAMRQALELERDAQARSQLKSYIDALEALLNSALRPEAAPAPRRPMGPQDIERLYEAGVDLYSQGRLLEAAASFRRILEADPNNVSARRALDRVQTEILQTGGVR